VAEQLTRQPAELFYLGANPSAGSISSYEQGVMLADLINLWLFYVVGYAIAYPLRNWAQKKRGEPFEDPELLSQKRVMIPAMLWILGGFVISLFVPINFGILFYFGLTFAIIGVIIVGYVFYSFAHNPGLAIRGIYRYSRNPNYIGWTIFFLGLTLIGWSESIWSLFFLIYLLYTIGYFYWIVLQEEVFLANKYGDSYREYLKRTPRYFGKPRK
jgi:protein-S-isoprenylcysteine O-methyltransferase Ste14